MKLSLHKAIPTCEKDIENISSYVYNIPRTHIYFAVKRYIPGMFYGLLDYVPC